MECELTVAGLGLRRSASPLGATSSRNDAVLMGKDGDGYDPDNINVAKLENHQKANDSGTNSNAEEPDRDTDKKRLAVIKSGNAMCLVSFTEYTRGSVNAASTIQQIIYVAMDKTDCNICIES